MSRRRAEILGGICAGAATSAVRIFLPYVVEGSLSQNDFVSAVLMGVAVAVLYTILSLWLRR